MDVWNIAKIHFKQEEVHYGKKKRVDHFDLQPKLNLLVMMIISSKFLGRENLGQTYLPHVYFVIY